LFLHQLLQLQNLQILHVHLFAQLVNHFFFLAQCGLHLALDQLKLISLLRLYLLNLSVPPVIRVLSFKDKSLVLRVFLLKSSPHLGHYLIPRLPFLIINSLQLLLNFLILLLNNLNFFFSVLKFNFQIINPSAEHLQIVVQHRLRISFRMVPLPKLLYLSLEFLALLIVLRLDTLQLLFILRHDLLLCAVSLIAQFFNYSLNFFVTLFDHVFTDLPLHLYMLVLCLLQQHCFQFFLFNHQLIPRLLDLSLLASLKRREFSITLQLLLSEFLPAPDLNLLQIFLQSLVLLPKHLLDPP
jgi:hypothetical protein